MAALGHEYLAEHFDELSAAEASMGAAPESKSTEERVAWAAAFREKLDDVVAAKARARGSRCDLWWCI